LPDDIANLVRQGRSSVSSRLLIVKFMSIIKRNEWLAAARRKRGFIARDIKKWPSDRISIYEQSIASERLAFRKARALALFLQREACLNASWYDLF